MEKHLLLNNSTPIDFHSKTHPPQNGNNIITNQSNEDDLEMVSFDMDYTSLKDLMPASTPTSMASPTGSMRDSWKEIPIKDQLVRNAAWAYLQPMVAAPDEDVRWWVVLKDKFCGIFGCINDVVLVMFYGFSSEKDCDEDEGCYKVD